MFRLSGKHYDKRCKMDGEIKCGIFMGKAALSKEKTLHRQIVLVGKELLNFLQLEYRIIFR